MNNWLRDKWSAIRGLIWHGGRTFGADYTSAARRLEYAMAYVGSNVEIGLESSVDKLIITQEAYIELLAAAWLKATGLDPQNAELVEEHTGTGIKFYFRERKP